MQDRPAVEMKNCLDVRNDARAARRIEARDGENYGRVATLGRDIHSLNSTSSDAVRILRRAVSYDCD